MLSNINSETVLYKKGVKRKNDSTSNDLMSNNRKHEELFALLTDLYIENCGIIPQLTFLNSERNYSTEKLLPIKIINVMLAEIVHEIPQVFKYNDVEFSLIQIKGVVTSKTKSITDKTIFHVDDGTGYIKVIYDTSKNENWHRINMKSVIENTVDMNRMEKKELLQIVNQSEKQMFDLTTEDKNRFLFTVTHILATTLDEELEIKYPTTNIQFGDIVVVVGKLIHKVDRRCMLAYKLKKDVSNEEYHALKQRYKYNLKEELLIM